MASTSSDPPRMSNTRASAFGILGITTIAEAFGILAFFQPPPNAIGQLLFKWLVSEFLFWIGWLFVGAVMIGAGWPPAVDRVADHLGWSGDHVRIVAFGALFTLANLAMTIIVGQYGDASWWFTLHVSAFVIGTVGLLLAPSAIQQARQNRPAS